MGSCKKYVEGFNLVRFVEQDLAALRCIIESIKNNVNRLGNILNEDIEAENKHIETITRALEHLEMNINTLRRALIVRAIDEGCAEIRFKVR